MSANNDVTNMLTYGELLPRWQCKFFWHRWTKWITVHEARYGDTSMRYEELRRVCRHCGVADLKQVTERKR